MAPRAVIIAMVLLAGACGATTSTSDSETSAGQEFVEAIVVRQAADEDLSETERRCIAAGIVDTVGVDAFEASGVTPDGIEEGGAFLGGEGGGVVLDDGQAGELTEVFTTCTDAFDLLFGGLTDVGTLSDDQAVCLNEHAETSSDFRAYLQDAIVGDDSRWFTTEGGGRAPRPAFVSMAQAIYDGCGVERPEALADDPAPEVGAEDEQTRPVVVAGAALPQGAGTPGDPAVGMPAPRLEGQSFDGTPVVVAPGRGKLVLVFGAHWCPYCNAELQQLQAWVDAGGKPDDVELVAVSTSARAGAVNYPPSVWLGDAIGWTSPVLADDASGSAGRAYGIGSIPMIVAVDADGTVAGRTVGQLPGEDFEAFLSATLGD